MEDRYHQPFMVVRYTMFGADTKPLSYRATPRLIEAGPTQAYESGGYWRCRDDKFDPPGTEYTRVVVVRNPEYQRF